MPQKRQSMVEACLLVRQAERMLRDAAKIIRSTNVLCRKAKALQGAADCLLAIEDAIERHWESAKRMARIPLPGGKQ